MGQDASLGFLFLLYVFQGFKYVLWDVKKDKKKQEERKQARASSMHSRAMSTNNELALGTLGNSNE